MRPENGGPPDILRGSACVEVWNHWKTDRNTPVLLGTPTLLLNYVYNDILIWFLLANEEIRSRETFLLTSQDKNLAQPSGLASLLLCHLLEGHVPSKLGATSNSDLVMIRKHWKPVSIPVFLVLVLMLVVVFWWRWWRWWRCRGWRRQRRRPRWWWWWWWWIIQRYYVVALCF